jgi:hypothetical protein
VWVTAYQLTVKKLAPPYIGSFFSSLECTRRKPINFECKIWKWSPRRGSPLKKNVTLHEFERITIALLLLSLCEKLTCHLGLAACGLHLQHTEHHLQAQPTPAHIISQAETNKRGVSELKRNGRVKWWRYMDTTSSVMYTRVAHYIIYL